MSTAQVITSVLILVTIMHVFLLGIAYLILLERKIASWAQDRIGPNRVGPWGLLQPIADGIKFLMKEEFNPAGADKALFLAAPVLALIPALLTWAIIPWGGVWDGGVITIAGHSINIGVVHVSGLDINVGVVYILSIASLGVYGVVIGAWASNNKYAFFGGLRATAQMLSYEIPMGIMVLCVLLMAGSAYAEDILAAQLGYWHGFIPAWNVFQQPIAAVLFFTCLLAEANRAPFDLAECEQELIAGFHTEYSSMKFALFFLGEYMHMLAGSAFFTLMFLGGWHLPWIDLVVSKFLTGQMAAQTTMSAGLLGFIAVIVKVHVFLGKVVLLVAIMMWIRWTLPRFRFDQLMKLAWRALIPLSLLLLLMTGAFVHLGWQDYLWAGNILVLVVTAAIMPLLPADPVNRKVPLAGSRFSPLAEG